MSVQSILQDIDDALLVLNRARTEIARMEAPSQPVSEINTSPEPVKQPASSLTGLPDPGAFFNSVRSSKALGPTLSSGEVEGCECILTACSGLPIAWTAYALATAAHETAFSMQPIKEIGGTAYFTRMYDINGERPAKARELGNLTPGDGAKYCGRGYVQLTGRLNYAKAGEKVGVDFVSDPDLVMQPEYAAAILRRGMVEGWFTGKTLGTYLPSEASQEQFRNARRIINGLDKAEAIAGYAMEFQVALRAGGMK